MPRKVWTGSEWVSPETKVYDSSQWVSPETKVYDGSQWVSVGDSSGSGGDSSSVSIPSDSDWTDQGTVLTAGSGWDSYWDDCVTPTGLVELDGTWYMYYVGSEGTRSFDDGPAYRKVGVATSTSPTDPSSWSKSGSNPVITYELNDFEEEGVFCGAVEETSGTVYFFGAALVQEGSTTVNSDVRLWTSTDGTGFTDEGEVISHDDSSITGSGDELFPLGAWVENGTWYVYYSTNNWDLNVAWGPSPTEVSNNTANLYDPSGKVFAGCQPVVLDDTVAMPVVVGDIESSGTAEVFEMSRSELTDIGTQRATWEPGSMLHMVADRTSNTWLFPYMTTSEDEVRLLTAPV
jgi:hypothetical protein